MTDDLRESWREHTTPDGIILQDHLHRIKQKPHHGETSRYFERGAPHRFSLQKKALVEKNRLAIYS
jgi:hypothetical protein